MKPQLNTEIELINQALSAFERETSLKTHLRLNDQMVQPLDILQIEWVNGIKEFEIDVLKTVNDFLLSKRYTIIKSHHERNVLITKGVTTHLAKKMKEMQIQFIDAAGNAYINRPPLFVFMHGNKAALSQTDEVAEDLFGIAGIRVIFALLCKENLVNGTYREIADAAGVALGSVVSVMKDLIRRNYVIDLTDRGRTIVQKQNLADKWAEAYATKFRAKKLIGRYSAPREQPWRDTDLEPLNALWGGEVAANKLTNYLKPEIVTIYTRRPVDNLAMALKLRKDPHGNIELREQFWNFSIEADKTTTVPLLLTYADLLAIGDSRTHEAAEMINDLLQRHLK